MAKDKYVDKEAAYFCTHCFAIQKIFTTVEETEKSYLYRDMSARRCKICGNTTALPASMSNTQTFVAALYRDKHKEYLDAQ